MKKKETRREEEERAETPGQERQAPRPEADELQQKLESVQKERDELLGKLQRVSADYANFQKRVPRQISDSLAYEKDAIIRSLLPVLDNFDHTLKANSGESDDAFVRGVEIVYGQMLDVLRSHGVEQIQALGETFDPARHEAMLRREKSGKPDNIVLEEFQKGYMVNGRVIRPSRVVVNKVAMEPRSSEGTDEPPIAGESQNSTE